MVNYQFIYYLVLLLLALTGFYVFYKYAELMDQTHIKVKVRKQRFVQLQDFVRQSVSDQQIQSVFVRSGLPFSAYQYQLARYTIAVSWLLLILFTGQLKGGDVQNQLLLWLIVFSISSPKTSLFGRRTLFKTVMDSLIESRRMKQTSEIYRSILQLKNIALTKRRNPPGTLEILDQLRKYSSSTRYIWNRIIALWQEDRVDEACEYLKSAIPTKEVQDFAGMLASLDRLLPGEITGQLLLYQEIIRQDRKSKKMASNQKKGYLLTFVIGSAVVLCLLNFIVVTYFIDSMEAFKSI